jgi:hypothetical protein
VIGAENIGGTVDQKDVVALAGNLGGGLDGGRLCGGLFGWFWHGRNLGIFAVIDSLRDAMCRDFCVALSDPE